MKTLASLFIFLLILSFPTFIEAQCPSLQKHNNGSICPSSKQGCDAYPIKKKCPKMQGDEIRYINFDAEIEINDAVLGNGDGILDPLEEFTFDVCLTNYAFTSFSDVSVEFITDSTLVEVQPQTPIYIGDMSSGEMIFQQWNGFVVDSTWSNETFFTYLCIAASNNFADTVKKYLSTGCYICTESSNCGFGDGFTDVVLQEIENLDNGCSNTGYGDFTYMEATLEAGKTYAIHWASGYADNHADLYIDFNNDCEMYDPNELLIDDHLLSLSLDSATFTIPEFVTAGQKRLRLVACWQKDPECFGNNYCPYGEIEDYIVNIISSYISPLKNLAIQNSQNVNSLSWDQAIQSAAVYYVYKNGELITPQGITATSFDDTVVAPGPYEYCVSYHIDTLQSVPICETITLLPPAPGLISYTYQNGDIQLGWDIPEYFVSPLTYQVFREGLLVADNLSVPAYTDHNVAEGVYAYTICTVYEDFISEPSLPLLAYAINNPAPIPFTENFDAAELPDFWYQIIHTPGDTLMFTGSPPYGANFDAYCARFTVNSYLGKYPELISAPVSCLGSENVYLSFSRSFFRNYSWLEISYSLDGFNWSIFKTQRPGQLYTEIGETVVTDISEIAANQAFIVFRFAFLTEQYSSYGVQFAIDNIKIMATPPPLLPGPGKLNLGRKAYDELLNWCPVENALSYNVYNGHTLLEDSITVTQFELLDQGHIDYGLQVTTNTTEGESNGGNLFYFRNTMNSGMFQFDTLHYTLNYCETQKDSITLINYNSGWPDLVKMRNASCDDPQNLQNLCPLNDSGYCKPVSEPSGTFALTFVKVGNMHNSSGFHASGYSYFADKLVHLSPGHATLAEFNQDYQDLKFIKVWLDSNQDKQFGEDELVLTTHIPRIMYSWTDYLTVPENAATGYTRLRVRYSDNPGIGPCTDGCKGETEDYPVYISDTAAIWSVLEPDTNWYYHIADNIRKFSYKLNASQMLEGNYFFDLYLMNYKEIVEVVPFCIHVVEPQPPENLQAYETPTPDGYVNLFWSPPLGLLPMNYNVYRDGSLISTIFDGDTTFVDGPLPPGYYSYYICTAYESCESVPSNSIWVDIPVGFSEAKDFMQFQIYPNPARESFIILKPENTADFQAVFSGISGSSTYVVSGNKEMNQVLVGDWERGIYIVVITCGNFKQVHKLLLR